MKMKISPELDLWTKKNSLNSGSHLLLDPDPGIFEGLFYIARYDIFSHFGSYF